MRTFYTNLKLLNKLIIPILILIVVMAGIIWTARSGLVTISMSAARIVNVDAARMEAALQALVSVNEASIAEKNIIVEPDRSRIATYQERYKNAMANALSSADEMIALADTPERRAGNEKVKEAIVNFDKVNQRSIADGLRNDNDAAFKISSSEGAAARLALVELLETRVKKNKSEMSEASTADAAQSAAAENQLYAFAAAGIVGSMSLLGWVVVSMIVRPLAIMTGAMEKLAGGDLSVEVVGAERKDEVGTLARALVAFRRSGMENERLQAEQRSEQAAKAKRQVAIEGSIARFEDDMRHSLEALTSSASGMRATSQSMSATAEETSAQATTVAAAAEQASGNVQTVASATEELSSSVIEIGRQVTQSTKIAAQAVSEADRTNATVQGLSAAAQKIGDVVSLISDIASQTNLLALNATIEAARAGDAGKGFAVVASEVKGLATQTAKATEEIAAQVAAMQNITGEAVHAIQSIGKTIGSVNEIAAMIAAAVEEQGAATQEIARNIQEAAQGTNQVSATIAGVNEAANETGAASGRVLASADALGHQAETLRTGVDGFLASIRAA